MKKITLFSFAILAIAFLASQKSDAQNNNVGIGTLTPNSSAMLDVVSPLNDKGVLIPRMNTASMNLIPVSATTNGLIVYNTDSSCFCYYNSTASAWKSLCNAGGGGAAGPTGPAGTNGMTGPTGPVGPTGSGNGPTGPTGPAGTNGAAGTTGPAGANGVTGTTGTAGTNGTNGVTGPTGPSQTAWWILGNAGTNAATNFVGTTDGNDFVTKTSNTERMRSLSSGSTVVNSAAVQAGDVFSSYGNGYAGAISLLGDYAVNGYVSGTGAAIYGEQTSTGIGVFGNNTAGGAGVYGISATNYGVIGMANGTNVSGVRGFNANASGSGIIGLGNNITPGSVITGGCGVAANGTSFGSFSLGTNATGTGVVGTGNNLATSTTLVNGSGGAFSGTETGLYAGSTTTTGNAGQFNGTGEGMYVTTANPATYWGIVVGAGGGLASGDFWTNSDRRFKKDITPIADGTLDKIMKLNPCQYYYDADKYPMYKGNEGKQVGLIAQELEKVFPELVNNTKYMPDPTKDIIDPSKKSVTGKQVIDNVSLVKEKNNVVSSKKPVIGQQVMDNIPLAIDNIPLVKGYYAVDYNALIPFLIKGMQEQQKIIETQNKKIETLEKKVDQLQH
ncbi:MAG: tail fiber domain-containing protein [Bacteroidetes bacterium]|nr:tail fiber domain-containing protein [Bacteroidota bacterium]